ncbi:PAS domain-containing protein [Rubellimicrobium sp. CFH 75288]|uniref:PAS domain-containing protein n=1 Tax=Rubellimicrobium sp. CFH 75288 TaxID=2697034 RepID=UPI001412D766|nr:PAS domain-containing protein [Rubellimicrobium sp. CFH 75288]NAZ38151.1 PAS domain-containing protein [Rubellimicrobium sp. CFH 75288]
MNDNSAEASDAAENRRAAFRMGEQLDREHAAGDPFAAAIRRTRMPIIITDPRQPDNPIVFANDAFLKLTGYSRDEVIGRNCRFLQGPDTDRSAVAAIRRAIEEERDQFRCDILNYRKDGTTFWNSLFLSPVRDETGAIHFYFASQQDVTHRKAEEMSTRERAEALELEVGARTRELRESLNRLAAEADSKTLLLHELDHRVKNNLQTIAALIGMQARRAASPEAAEALLGVLGRVEALGTVHRRLYQDRRVDRLDIAVFAHDLAQDLVARSGRADIVLRFDLEPVMIGHQHAAPLALIVNELVTNALRHAFRHDGGEIRLAVRRTGEADGGGARLVVEDDGVGLPGQELGRGSFGRLAVELLASQLGTKPLWQTAEPGTRVVLDLPPAILARPLEETRP